MKQMGQIQYRGTIWGFDRKDAILIPFVRTPEQNINLELFLGADDPDRF